MCKNHPNYALRKKWHNHWITCICLVKPSNVPFTLNPHHTEGFPRSQSHIQVLQSTTQDPHRDYEISAFLSFSTISHWCWYLFAVGTVLCIEGCVAASLTSTQQLSGVTTDNQTCLQTMSNEWFWTANCSRLRTTTIFLSTLIWQS